MYTIGRMQCFNGSLGATVTVEIIGPDGRIIKDAANSEDGPEAALQAIERCLVAFGKTIDFQVETTRATFGSRGITVEMRVRRGEQTFVGKGKDDDRVQAVARAYANAVNKLF